MSTYDIDQLAIETSMVIHIEQITGGADVDCHCGADAVLYLASEPDMDPGPVCSQHAFQWIDATVHMLRDLFPVESEGGDAA